MSTQSSLLNYYRIGKRRGEKRKRSEEEINFVKKPQELLTTAPCTPPEEQIQTTPTINKSSISTVTKDAPATPTKDTPATPTKDTPATLTKDTLATPTKDTPATLTKDILATPTKKLIVPTRKTSVLTTPTKSLTTPIRKTTPTKVGSVFLPHNEGLLTTPTNEPCLNKFKSIEFTSPKKKSNNISRLLELPYHYKLLEEKFRSTLVILSMLENRKELCTFSKLKSSVQEMMRKNFEIKDVAQMKFVYPESLTLRQEKIAVKRSTVYPQNGYHLVISSTVSKWTSNTVSEKVKVFHERLISITLEHHRQYLLTLTPPLVIPNEKVCNWHISFELHKVPDIKLAELPRPPINDRYNTAADLLQQTEKKISNRVQAALESVAVKSQQTSSATFSTTPTLLKGVSQKLIERIRQKEATKALTSMVRKPEIENKLVMLSRLIEMSRIIRSLYITENAVALTWSLVMDKVRESHSSLLDHEQVEDHMKYLIEVIPQWLVVLKVKGKQYIKTKNKNISDNSISCLIEQKKQELLNLE